MTKLQLPAFPPKSILWFKFIIISKIKSKSVLTYCFLILFCANPYFAEAGNSDPHTMDNTGKTLLLSRLDLKSPQLERVENSSSNPSQAAVHLLEYYRTRLSVRHPVDRPLRTEMKGNYATTADIAIADNALKHIFVGQPAYPPHFCGDDINWGTRPVPDNEWTWQLNRMSFWDAMAKAYWHTGDEKYASAWCNQLTDWVEKNPRDKEHAYAWRSIEAGIRGYRWAGLFHHFLDAPSFTPEVLVAFMNSCYEHAEYLMTKYSSRSNWALMEAEGMAFIAITFPEFREATIWRDEAIRRLNNEITIQVYPDGHQRELAMGYHLGSIGWFLRTYDLALLNGVGHVFPEEYIQSIERMCEVPLKLSHPDGTFPQFGDAWAGKPGQYKKNFHDWSERFNRQDFLYLATDGARGSKPNATAYALKESGLYSMRSGWDANAICLLLKCGPDGGGHSQPDNGTFELSAGGRTLMPDAGSYIYSGDPENRAWFRQTRVHQTLTLDGKNSAYAPRLVLWQPGDSLDILVVENQSYPDLTHRRSIYFVDKKYFVLVDEAFGDAVGNVNLHFQLAPGEALIDPQDLTARTLFEDGWNLQVKTMQQEGLEMIEEEGQVSFLYTKKEPRPAFCYRIAKETSGQPVRFVTTLVPVVETHSRASMHNGAFLHGIVKTHGRASLLFQSGFEPGSTIKHGANPFTADDDIVGRDLSVAAPNDWVEDIDNSKNLGRFSLQYQGGDTTQRFARIIPEPGNPGNHILHFWLNEPNVGGSKGRIQANLYGAETGLKEFYQSVRIFLPEDFNTVRTYPDKIHWLTIVEFWNNITWSQTVPYRFRVTLGLGKPVATESDLYFIVDGQDCELFENGSQKYTTLWSEINHNVKVPIGKWFTMDYYYKEGDAQTGRFYLSVEPDGGERQVIFDLKRFTHNSQDKNPNGVTDFNPLKLYTSKQLIEYMKNKGKTLQIYWDDLELWTDRTP